MSILVGAVSFLTDVLLLTRQSYIDCLKLYTKAHGSKTTNLIINLDHDDWILDDDSVTLVSVGMGVSTFSNQNLTAGISNTRLLPENETELSFFNRELYEAFKLNPVQKW